MDIKTIPLSRLGNNLEATLGDVADSGEAVVVQLPDDRLVYIQGLGSGADDDLANELITSNPEVRELLAKSGASPRRPFGGGGT